MNEMNFNLLHELLSAIPNVSSKKEIEYIISEYSAKPVADKEAWKIVLEDIKKIGEELVSLKNSDDDNTARLLAAMTEQEREECAEVRKVIDENLFDYHFQPIVSTSDGEIYSYEALMRPRSSLCPSPYHVIKYAEVMDSLNDIERATFFNVLGILDSRKEEFGEKKVFINSIPRAKLNETDLERARVLFEKHSGSVVVEMTEQSEMGDGEFGAIKEMYSRMNVQLAIDDYGTGYSNVHNLLRYMPEYVKIDRSLMNDIHNNSKKRYFVREIIDFCHDNGILALAEGVETSEELRTVIMLGIDLIQGYYTARPSAVIAGAIPREIKQEIQLYRLEREEGRKLQIYTAEKNERVQLDRLEKDGYRCVVVGKSGSGDVTIAGSPGTDMDIHIDVANGFKGCVILEDARLIDKKHRPCIDIGEDCDVKLVISGTNYLKNGGIRVPESSKLTVSGDGGLSIFIEGAGSYAIGNDVDSRHGELLFEHGLNIESHAAAGVCIGSGLGGKISVVRGQFMINATGYIGVGIGALNADTDLDLFACDITIDLSVQMGVAIGSLENNCSAYIHNASVKMYTSGSDIVGIGTLSGSNSDIRICEASVICNIIADHCSGVSALNGDTRYNLDRAGMHMVIKGEKALALGGSGDTEVILINSDSTIDLHTKLENVNFVSRENVKIEGGRARFSINGEEIRSE